MEAVGAEEDLLDSAVVRHPGEFRAGQGFQGLDGAARARGGELGLVWAEREDLAVLHAAFLVAGVRVPYLDRPVGRRRVRREPSGLNVRCPRVPDREINKISLKGAGEMTKGKYYTPEFKEQAVKMVVESTPSRTIGSVGRRVARRTPLYIPRSAKMR